ncbi:MAG: hypothetical protein O6944_08065 [Gammaproteobacteria bacterium]|nr:hypothetical protein [Gammaproteobacteria bacterium]
MYLTGNSETRGLLVFLVAATLLWSTASGAAAAGDKKLLLWMDNSITGLVGGGFEIDDGDQYTATFEHASGWSFGDLFMFVDYTRFKNKTGDDNTAWYGEISPRLSIGKILKKDLSFSIFGQNLVIWKDTLLAVTYERGRDPDLTESLLVGLGFDLDLKALGIFGDKGFNYFQVNVYARNELNCCAGDKPDRGFKDLQITVSASYPFEVGKAKFLLDGFFDYVAGWGPQAENFHFVPQIKLDIGNFWGKPKALYVGVEIDYWTNKFGLKGAPGFETDQFAVSGIVKVHF